MPARPEAATAEPVILIRRALTAAGFALAAVLLALFASAVQSSVLRGEQLRQAQRVGAVAVAARAAPAQAEPPPNRLATREERAAARAVRATWAVCAPPGCP